MMEVRVKRDLEGNPSSVVVKGHALFAPHGSDIVCAAVSVLSQTVIYAAQDLLGTEPRFKMEEGFLSLEAPGHLEENIKEKYFLLVETMLLGLKETARSYPEQLVYKEN